MFAKILDGKELAKVLIDGLKKEVASLKKSTGGVPNMINIMIGDHYGSCAYANSQKRVAEEIGIRYTLKTLPEGTTQDELVGCLQDLNADPSVNGIMMHKPFPAHIDYQAAANILDRAKDVEGINVANVGKMLLGETRMIPCTPAAVMELIASTALDVRGREAIIVGASEIVGKPLSLLLLRSYATVTVCHIATSEAGKLRDHVARADILIVAVGKANLIPGAWIKSGALVIDVGINRLADKTVGDVDFDTAKTRAGFLTPVPGGVGPVTVVMLMRNGLEAYKMQKGK